MLSVSLVLPCLLLSWPMAVSGMGAARLAELRRETADVFYHGYSNYMQHAFPEDELRPISCTPLTRDSANPGNYDLNDVLGNFSLTLIDSLSTLAILAGTPHDDAIASRALHDFQSGVASFVEYYGDGRRGPTGQGLRARGFDLDSKVQVFETVIRGVGGLLSAHLFAIGELPIPGYKSGRRRGASNDAEPLEIPPISWPHGFKYDGQLLRLALDLGERLLPAFYTNTGLPYPRVNLRHGIPFYLNSPLHENARHDPDAANRPAEKTETCSAGAGSLVLEFSVLSRMTGDPRFEQLAKRAFWAIWKQKSDIGLVGNAIDPELGHWVSVDAGIGAGIDSFFEYALKSHILLSGHELPNLTMPEPPTDRPWLDPNTLHELPLSAEENSSGAFLEAWHHAHAAIKRHLYNDNQHPYYMTGHRTRGFAYTSWIDSLAAFYPGLLAMAGEVEEAEEANLLYTALWTRYGALPERWSVQHKQVDNGIGWWPGRPEFIESTYHLYRATKDPWYLYVGEMVLKDIKRLCYTECGWSGLQNVESGEKADRMQSFFLGETAKYLYLLFDPDHPLNKFDAAYVFTTEAHPLLIPRERSQAGTLRKKAAKKDVQVYYDESYTNSCPLPARPVPLTGSVLAARPDVFHAANFVNLYTTSNPHSGIVISAGEGGGVPVPRYRANHTFFPWTLPPSLIPDNGTCAKLPEKPMLVIEFPNNVQPTGMGGSALNYVTRNHPARKVDLGVRIDHLNGLKLYFVREESFEAKYDHTWRVIQVNNLLVGKDEPIFIDADVFNGISDPLFNRVRYASFVEVIMMQRASDELNTSVKQPPPAFTPAALVGDGLPLTNEQLSELQQEFQADKFQSDYKAFIRSWVRAVTSVFEPTNTPSPELTTGKTVYTFPHFLGALPVGVGAVPLPDVPDAPLPTNGSPIKLPWKTVYLAGHACAARLPDDAPKHHQVIVMRRGGCSFSEKLANIPSFTPREKSLQLVIIVDDEELEDDTDDEDGGDGFFQQIWEYQVIKPKLDEEQRTPNGLPRHRPIAMIMVRGARRGAYEQLGAALGIGVRRKYFIESQGRKIDNLHVL